MDHTATTREMFERISAGDIDGLGATIADDFVEHEELPGFAPTKEGVLDFFRMLLVAFPDLRMEPQDILPSADKVVARVRMTGTHRGPFMGVPATGEPIDVQVIDIMRFDDDGLVHEHWGVMDAMLMMQQIGVVPGPTST